MIEIFGVQLSYEDLAILVLIIALMLFAIWHDKRFDISYWWYNRKK